MFPDGDHTARLLLRPTQLGKSQTAVYAIVSRPMLDDKPVKHVECGLSNVRLHNILAITS